MYLSIVNFFTQILQSEKITLEKIQSHQGDLYLEFDKNNKPIFIFSLPALHQFLDTHKTLNYIQFRKLIYQGTINSALSKLGGIIEIQQSNNKVDKTLYVLRER